VWIAASCVVTPALAQDTAETADTGFFPGDTDTDTDTDTDVDTDVDTDTDTGLGFCVDCQTAAEIAGEQGGTPCATGGALPLAGGALWLPLAWAVRRRRG
jgi:hypothetical protein